MTPFRILADLLDPGRRIAERELRETAVRAEQARAVDAVDHAITVACWRALYRKSLRDADALRADVARLLEAGARCAHEHHS